MVIKRICKGIKEQYKFESSVISYGNQTSIHFYKYANEFESSVISYGNQTKKSPKSS